MNNVSYKKAVDDLKFVYSENNTLSIIFKNNNILMGVVGEFNNNLKELEKITDTSIYSRGNSILVKSTSKKNEIVKSIRGKKGGYTLNKTPSEIKISEILSAVEEKVKTIGCQKHSKKGCNGKSAKCITHNLWDELETHINVFFQEKKLGDLINKTENRL